MNEKKDKNVRRTTMAVKVNPNNMTTGIVTFSYVKLFEPEPNQSGIMKYSVCVLLDKGDKAEKKKWDAAIEAAIEIGIAKGKFTANQRTILKRPIRDGDAELKTEQKKGDEYKNSWFINTNANVTDKHGNPVPPPQIMKPEGGVAVPVLDPTEFYSGCKGRAIISFYPFNADGTKGIAVAINGAYKTSDGERLDGRVNAASAFAEFAAQDSTEDEGTEPADDFS